MMQQHEVELELIAITSELLAESGETHHREIKMDASLQRHLGIDSLGRAELFRRVEKSFDVSLPDKLLAEAETLGDITAFLLTAAPVLKTTLQRAVVTTHGERSYVDPSHVSTLIDLLLLYGEKSPGKQHIFFQHENGQEEIITYGQLLESSLRVAAGLTEIGLKPGEAVSIMLPTTPGFFYAFYGVLLAGGVPVPIYPPFRMHMLETYAKTEARILRNAEVRIMITFEQAEKLSRLLQGFVPSLKAVTTVEQLLRPQPLSSLPGSKEDHHAFIQYTSGSTSDPKGVLLTHYNLLSNIRAYGKAIRVTPEDVVVSWLPLYHDFGLIGAWLGSLYHGVPLVLMTPFTFLNHPERWLWVMHYHRGTITGAPNFAYELCVRKVDHFQLEGLDLSSWRIAANGAEKVYPRTLEQFVEKFAPFGFRKNAMLPVYGLAESTVGLAIPPIERGFRIDNIDRKLFEEERRAVPTNGKSILAFAGCGMPLEGHEIRIVDDEGQTLPERYVGNLQFRGPSNMQGYFNNPSATQAIYHDGWLDSGDLAYLAEKEVFITGRRKDLIIKAGRNLYPAEIEEMVGNVTGVRQGCVVAFGATDPERGTEQLIVVAETREKSKAKREAITEQINETVSTALDMAPDRVVLVAPKTVPKTSSGKLQRAACKILYLEGRLGKIRMPAWLQVCKLAAGWLGQKIAHTIIVLGLSIYTAYVLAVVTVMFFPLYLIVRFSSEQTAAKTMRVWSRLTLRFAFVPMKVIGAEHLTRAAPVIYAANHASYVDALVALAVSPPGVRFVAKKELFSVPIIRTFMRKLDYLPVDRIDLSRGLDDTLQMEAALKSGHSLFIFPEGTFGYAAGLRPFRLGAFKIAAETGVSVCPVAISGARKIFRDESRLLRPGKLVVTVCEPITPAGSEWQDVTQLRQAVRMAIAEHCGEPSLDFIAAQTVAIKPPGYSR